MRICIFEDHKVPDFEPLILSRPVYDLICGSFTLKQKIVKALNLKEYSLSCRKYLQKITERSNGGIPVNTFQNDDYLFINGRILATDKTFEQIKYSNNQIKAFISDDQIIAAYIPKSSLSKAINSNSDFPDFSFIKDSEKESVQVTVVNYVWDLINQNGKEIVNDYNLRITSHNNFNYLNEVSGNAHLIKDDNIFIEENVIIKPGVVIDASNGPVYIEKNSIIFPNAVIEGPFFLGESGAVKSGATIYANTSVGKVCKIGGEIEQSVFMPYSNKQHSGFLGHSYIGSWVNIGADTNNSDLKNNYSKIKMSVNSKEINTGLQFLGVIIGDHSKTGINTMFNTGTTVGFSSNIFGADYPEKYIPSFSWGGSANTAAYNITKSIETARIVCSRRNIDFTETDEILFNDIYKLTRIDRDKKGY